MALPKLETPTYTIELPSNGKKIVYRPFLVKEFKILLTLSQADDEEIIRVIKNLVRSCTFDSVDIDALPHFDIEYLFMNIRAKSISEVVDVIITCNSCSNKYEHSFSIDDLSVVKQDSHTNCVNLTETISVIMKYPSFETVARLMDSKEDSAFDVVVESINGIQDGDSFYEAKDQTKEDLAEFVNSLTREQFSRLEDFFKTAPKIVQQFDSTCNSCGKTNTTKLEGLQNFFV